VSFNRATVPLFQQELAASPGAFPQAIWVQYEGGYEVVLTSAWLGTRWSAPDTVLDTRAGPLTEPEIAFLAVGQDGRTWVAAEGPGLPDYDRDIFITYSDWFRGARTFDFQAERKPEPAVSLSWEIRRNSALDLWRLLSIDVPSLPAEPSRAALRTYSQAREVGVFRGDSLVTSISYTDSASPELPARLYWLIHTYPNAISDTLGPAVVDFSAFVQEPAREILLHPVPYSPTGDARLFLRIPRGDGLLRVCLFSVSGDLATMLWRGTGVDDEVPRYLDIAWNGRDQAGTRIASGVYFVVAEYAGGGRTRQKLVVVG
jgi:hypothetical protein